MIVTGGARLAAYVVTGRCDGGWRPHVAFDRQPGGFILDVAIGNREAEIVIAKPHSDLDHLVSQGLRCCRRVKGATR